MLCCIGELAMFVFGIIAIATGKFSLSRTRVVRGSPARVIGILLLLPLILASGGEFLIGAMKGAQLAARGEQFDFQRMQREIGKTVLILHVAVTAGILLGVTIVAVVNARPAGPKRRRIEEEDDYEEFDRFEDERRRGPEDRIRE